MSRAKAESHRFIVLERNIVYLSSGRLLSGTWSSGVELNGNLYFGANSWDDWRKSGKDKTSLIADPAFVDAARSDFRLLPQSPAWKLWFTDIDVNLVGPRK